VLVGSAPVAPLSTSSASFAPKRRYRNGFSKFVQPDWRRMTKPALYSCAWKGGAPAQSARSGLHRAGNEPGSNSCAEGSVWDMFTMTTAAATASSAPRLKAGISA
jgi:hypothetical protein